MQHKVDVKVNVKNKRNNKIMLITKAIHCKHVLKNHVAEPVIALKRCSVGFGHTCHSKTCSSSFKQGSCKRLVLESSVWTQLKFCRIPSKPDTLFKRRLRTDRTRLLSHRQPCFFRVSKIRLQLEETCVLLTGDPEMIPEGPFEPETNALADP